MFKLKTFISVTQKAECQNIYIRSWDLYNGFRQWKETDKEIQNALVTNIVYMGGHIHVDIDIKKIRNKGLV